MLNRNQIAFSENWNNKLAGAKYFTTIRIHNPRKYYPGALLEVKWNNTSFQAKVESILTKKLSEYSKHELCVDTGYELEEAIGLFKKFYPKENVDQLSWDYILLRRVTPDELKAQEVDLFSGLDKLKHPDLQAKEKAIQRLKEIYSLGKVAFLDTETTSFEGELVELAIVNLEGKAIFNELVRPVKNQMDQGAFDTHKISLESLQDKDYLYVYQNKLKEIFDEYFIIIYNKEFDTKILKNSFEWNSLLEEKPQIIVDVDKINSDCLMNLYAIIKGEKSSKSYHTTGFRTWKLTEACKDRGIDTTGITAHRAEADCNMTRMLFIDLLKEGK